MWRYTSCKRGWDSWSKSRVWDYRIEIDDIMCDDITCEDLHLASVAGTDDIICDDQTYDDLNPESEIIGLGLMI